METRLDRHLTAADLDDLPHEWDTRYELIGGVLHMSTRPSHRHQRIIATLVAELVPVLRAVGCDVVPEPGVIWELDGEDNVAPDVAIVLGPPPASGKLRSCPDIVVEVLSPGKENRLRDTVAKRELYWRRGAKEYWIVDDETKTVLRLTRGDREWTEERLDSSATLRTPLIGTLSIPIAKIFV